MRKVLVVVVALQLLPPNLPALGGGRAEPVNTQQAIEAIPAGALIEVRLNNKQKLRGRRGEVFPDSFILRQISIQHGVSGGTAPDQKISFAEVRSLSRVKSPASHTRRNVLIAVGVTIAALGVLVVAAIETFPGPKLGFGPEPVHWCCLK